MGWIYENGKHKVSGRYLLDKEHFINLGYMFEHNKKVSFAVEYWNELSSGLSDTILVIS